MRLFFYKFRFLCWRNLLRKSRDAGAGDGADVADLRTDGMGRLVADDGGERRRAEIRGLLPCRARAACGDGEAVGVEELLERLHIAASHADGEIAREDKDAARGSGRDDGILRDGHGSSCDGRRACGRGGRLHERAGSGPVVAVGRRDADGGLILDERGLRDGAEIARGSGAREARGGGAGILIDEKRLERNDGGSARAEIEVARRKRCGKSG